MIAGLVGVAGLGLLCIWVGWRGGRGQLSMRSAGIRTGETLDSERSWRHAHQAASGWMLAAGAVFLVTAVTAWALRPLATGVVLAVGVAVAVVLLLTAGTVGVRAVGTRSADDSSERRDRS